MRKQNHSADFFILLQKILPQHALSRLAGKIADSERIWLKNFLIKQFNRVYKVNLLEAEREDVDEYVSFNDFFTRKLKANARKQEQNENYKTLITSPVDGEISQYGQINEGQLIQAKGISYSLLELLGGDEKAAETYENGSFITIYLSPKDYHRVHMSRAGKLLSMTYVPGKLFSVNQTTTEHLPNLFARNERVVSYFEGDEKVQHASVMVGAMIVGSIETVWDGIIAPPNKTVSHFLYKKTRSVSLKQGEEMGRFRLGSTVILLFSENNLHWEERVRCGNTVKLGQGLAFR